MGLNAVLLVAQLAMGILFPPFKALVCSLVVPDCLRTVALLGLERFTFLLLTNRSPVCGR